MICVVILVRWCVIKYLSKNHELIKERVRLAELLQEKARRADIVTWITDNAMKNERSVPLEFTKHNFLMQPYRDWSPRMVSMKAAQVGFTTMAILKVVWMAARFGRSCIYTLPTDDDVRKMAHSKVNPIFTSNSEVAKLIMSNVDSIYQKRIGSGHVFWEGTKGQSRGIMVSADLVVHDELDRSDQSTIEIYESRIAASDYKAKWLFSNPSRPNVGVHRFWEMSDKKHWHIKCPRCNKQQRLTYFDNVCKERKAFVCSSCNEILPQEARVAGEWIAETKDADWSGYHISQVIAPWISAQELVEAELTKTKDYFYNFVLGLPVIAGANSVGRTVILKNCVESSPMGRWTLLGVDIGRKLHCVQGTEQGITKVFTLPDWDSLESYFRANNIDFCILDSMPEIHAAEKLVRKYPGRVYRALYDYSQTREEVADFMDDGESMGIVKIHRTRAIDHTLAEYEKGNIKVFISPHDPQLVGEQRRGVIEECLCGHWESLYVPDPETSKDVRYDRMGNVVRSWDSSGPDHFAHANLYYEMARQRKLLTYGTGVGLASEGRTGRARKGTLEELIERCKREYEQEEGDGW